MPGSADEDCFSYTQALAKGASGSWWQRRRWRLTFRLSYPCQWICRSAAQKPPTPTTRTIDVSSVCGEWTISASCDITRTFLHTKALNELFTTGLRLSVKTRMISSLASSLTPQVHSVVTLLLQGKDAPRLEKIVWQDKKKLLHQHWKQGDQKLFNPSTVDNPLLYSSSCPALSKTTPWPTWVQSPTPREMPSLPKDSGWLWSYSVLPTFAKLSVSASKPPSIQPRQRKKVKAISAMTNQLSTNTCSTWSTFPLKFLMDLTP